MDGQFAPGQDIQMIARGTQAPPSSGAKSKAYLGNASDATALTTYTFASQPLGTASSDRVIVCMISQGGTSTATVSSCTINGVAATLYQNITANQGPSQHQGGCIAVASVPSGTTGTVEVVCSAGRSRCTIGLWGLTGCSATPVDTDSVSNTDPASVTLTSTAGGYVIGGASERVAGTYTWTSATEDFDLQFDYASRTYSGASASTAGSSVTVTADYSGTESVNTLTAATFF